MVKKPLELTNREIRALLEAAAHYDNQHRPPLTRHLRTAAHKLRAATEKT